jgi:hypothetical protein
LEKEIALKRVHESNSSSNQDDNAVADFKDLKRLRLAPAEWSHLRAITRMLSNFKTATNKISENDKPQIPYIWMMYNRLFDFLDQMTLELSNEEDENGGHDSWPDVVKAAAERGKKKLSKYYSRTEDERGYLYNCATILDPSQKLTTYEVCLSQIFITYVS